MDISNLTDAELDSAHNDILNEKERRERLKNIPGQVLALSTRFVNDGGNPDELVYVVE